MPPSRKTLRAEVREGDVVGRFGGEEFVVLLRDLEPTSAGRRQMAAVAERIRARVGQLAVAVNTPDGPLTIDGLSTSVGAVFDLGPHLHTPAGARRRRRRAVLRQARRAQRREVRAAGRAGARACRDIRRPEAAW